MNHRFRAAFVALALMTSAGSARAEDLWKTLPDPAPLPKPDQSGLAPVNDFRMYYEVYHRSGGSPVLLLHGGMGSGQDWGNQVPALVKKHEVIVIDSRGQGRSTRGDRPFDYHLMATDVVALMDYLKLGKVAIVGWSDGGIIGIDLAIHAPNRVGRLLAYGANFNASGLDSSIESNPFFARVMAKLAAGYQKLSPNPGGFDSLMQAMSGMWSTQPDFQPAELATIRSPTLIADGQYEEGIKPAHTAELARLIPGARLVILPNVGHMGPWQDPQAFNRMMTRFLDTR